MHPPFVDQQQQLQKQLFKPSKTTNSLNDDDNHHDDSNTNKHPTMSKLNEESASNSNSNMDYDYDDLDNQNNANPNDSSFKSDTTTASNSNANLASLIQTNMVKSNRLYARLIQSISLKLFKLIENSECEVEQGWCLCRSGPRSLTPFCVHPRPMIAKGFSVQMSH